MKRGEVWWVDMPGPAGRRPAVLLSRDAAYRVRAAITVAPITRTLRNIPVEVIFQTIEDLHKACPNNLGDWYFTGNYPTPGGNRVVNRAFMNYMEGKKVRGY